MIKATSIPMGNSIFVTWPQIDNLFDSWAKSYFGEHVKGSGARDDTDCYIALLGLKASDEGKFSLLFSEYDKGRNYEPGYEFCTGNQAALLPECITLGVMCKAFKDLRMKSIGKAFAMQDGVFLMENKLNYFDFVFGPAKTEFSNDITTDCKNWENSEVSQTGYWHEIQNDYFSADVDPAQGDIVACISIDAWHVGEEQGQVIANVLLSKHGDVLVDYHDCVAMHDEMAQKAIGEAKNQLREYFRDLGHSERGNPDVQQHISVETPIGEIYVGITQLDPDYPGIFVDLKGQNVNAQFEKETVALAVIEFNPEKTNIQTLVWQNANQEDYTFAVEHENLVVVPSLSKQIQSASSRAEKSLCVDKAPVKESTHER